MTYDPPAFFSALSDPTRLRALVLLLREGELCVCRLVGALEVSQPKMSRHLATLREAGLLRDRRQGQWVHYRVAEDLPAWAAQTLAALAADLPDLPPYRSDLLRLRTVPARTGTAA
ncbi:HTH-type transcriptional repressor AseR [mine drainage metagenome]|uniref:HTH-type transcriptional repressor AseR n=1 Tax=mine drainage metagenome TaxID=410659 RepID=A0A1J5RA17_9ZZZZ